MKKDATEMSLSRRSFLGIGALAMAGLGAAGLAGCAPSTAGSGDEELSSTGNEAAADWLGSAPEIDESSITETVETEVVCVGAGIAGLITAAVVGELGGKAVVLEKLSVPSTFRTDIAGIGTRLQKEHNVEIDKAALIHELQMYMSGAADGRLLKVWADESGDAVNWILDLLDEAGTPAYLETDPGAEDMIYKEWPVTHGFNDATAAMDTLVARVQNNGGEIRFECPMVKIERGEDGRVTGVIAQNLKGDGYVRVNASKGVVIATGGYATNDEMLKALNPDMYAMSVMKEMTPSQEGDGIKAALWIGAAMDEDPLIQSFERGCVPFGPDYDGPSEDGQIWWVGSQPFLRTTMKGERFSNESTPYDFAMRAIRTHHSNTWIELFDANWQDQIAQFKTVGCSRIVDPGTMPGWAPTMPMEAIMGMFQGYLEGGLIQQADTIEELAELTGADPDTLVATVKRYNELCAKGVDEDFYKESSRMLPLDTPPFYAARMGGMILATQDGLTVNADMQVLDTEGNVIEGLYAAGNDCGSTYTRTYPSRVAGLTMGRNVTFAHHVAKHLMSA